MKENWVKLQELSRGTSTKQIKKNPTKIWKISQVNCCWQRENVKTVEKSAKNKIKEMTTKEAVEWKYAQPCVKYIVQRHNHTGQDASETARVVWERRTLFQLNCKRNTGEPVFCTQLEAPAGTLPTLVIVLLKAMATFRIFFVMHTPLCLRVDVLTRKRWSLALDSRLRAWIS